jgi:hypothetical protein
MYYELRFFKAFFFGANFCNGDKIFGKNLRFMIFQHNFDLNWLFLICILTFSTSQNGEKNPIIRISIHKVLDDAFNLFSGLHIKCLPEYLNEQIVDLSIFAQFAPPPPLPPLPFFSPPPI